MKFLAVFADQGAIDSFTIDCGLDGMSLIFAKRLDLVDGRIFVRGQTENPFCSKRLNEISEKQSDYIFNISYAHCNVRFEEPDTIGVTVIVQRHPMFITQTADAYDLRCTYPIGSRKVVSHVNVSEITTTNTIIEKGTGPICHLTVTNENDELIDTAIVGEVLRLALSVIPNDTYAILPRNCFAVNLETGERYSLTDEVGCAIDTQLFPEWTYKDRALTTATFRTFKWPDSSMIRFQCDCSACIDSCPKIDCDEHREEVKAKERKRFSRNIGNVADFNSKIIVNIPHRLIYSSALHVDEEEESRRAQLEMNEWKYQGSTGHQPFEETIQKSGFVRTCIRTIWIGLSICPLVLMIAIITFLSLIWRRKSSRDFKSCPTNNADTDSSYLKF